VQRRKIIIIGGMVLLCASLLGVWFFFPADEWLQSFSHWARGYGTTGVVVVCLGYVLATMLLVPGLPMTLAIAVVYGWWAVAICFGCGMVAALLSFLTSRFVARNFVKRILAKRPTLKALDAVAHEETFKTILLIRLNPVTPFAVENYAFGATGVRLGPFLLATGLGIIPGTLLNVWIGIIGRTAASGEASLANWLFLGLGLIAAVALVIWLTSRAKTKMQEYEGPQSQNLGPA
jgi:uncharacterized membrane protein YdjX (TVP38/TMEM64 family)